jgi:hypothetical protein
MKTLFNVIGSGSNALFVRRNLTCLSLSAVVLLFPSLAYGGIVTAETADLKVTLDTATAALTVTDKNAVGGNVVWTQYVPMGFSVPSFVQISGSEFTAHVVGPMYYYDIDLRIETSPGLLKSFHLTVTPQDPTPGDGYNYVNLPAYPFMFAQSNGGGSWYYVQNNGGEGTLMPLVFPNNTIRGLGGWAGSQPWWGVTNLTHAMMARLDSFVQIKNPGMDLSDPSAYAWPLQIEYSFYRTLGYVALAKAYRDYFLSLPNPPAKLAVRAGANPDLLFLKDSTYAYFWDDAEALFEQLSDTMKTAGLNRVVAMFNLGRPGDPDRLTQAMLDHIAAGGTPWIGGKYCIPTPNLSSICSRPGGWVNDLLLGNVTEQQILAYNVQHPPTAGWDQLDTDYSEPYWNTGHCSPTATPSCPSGLPYLVDHYGPNLRVIYHDTLPQQLGPSIDPPMYVQTIDANKTGRQKILDDTHLPSPNGFGLVAGSGEGISAFWTIPHLDYWEGGMEESTYGDISRHPIEDHCYEFASTGFPCDNGLFVCGDQTPYDICNDVTHGESWYEEEVKCLDEQARIPLLALQWHDYVAETWNWRNSTFVVSNLSWKKDLFNILYGGMPMWHVTNALWTAHSADYIASYWKLLPVRTANGFAEMTSHGWWSKDPTNFPTDRSIQYTDWDNANRVIVNFDSADYKYTNPNYGSIMIPSHGYAMLPDPVSQNCEGMGTPTGWTNSGATPNWDYTPALDGTQSLLLPSTIGTAGSSTKIDFGDRPEVWVNFKLRLTATPQGTNTIGGLAPNGISILSQLFQINKNGSLNRLSFGGAQTAAGVLPNTTYNVWLHYRKGTGSNGIVDIAFSTSATKPTSGSQFAQSTTYTGVNNAGRLVLGTSVNTTFGIILDDIRVAHAEIGNVPCVCSLTAKEEGANR